MSRENAQVSITYVTSGSWQTKWNNQLAYLLDMVASLSDKLANIANKIPHWPCTLFFAHWHNIFARFSTNWYISQLPYTNIHWTFTSRTLIIHYFVQLLVHLSLDIDMTYLHTYVTLTLSHYAPHNHIWTYLLFYKLLCISLTIAQPLCLVF
jgi:hypothetical protein